MKTLLVLLVSIIALSANAQWQRTSYLGDPRSIAYNGRVLFVTDTTSRVRPSVYSSSDLGATWTVCQASPRDMLQLIARGSNVYGTSFAFVDSGTRTTIWRSTNDGQTWDSLWGGLGYNGPFLTKDGMAFQTNDALEVTTDDIHWTKRILPPDAAGTRIYVDCASDSMLVAYTYHSSNMKPGLLLSFDLGTTWIERNLPDSTTGGPMVAYGSKTLVAWGGSNWPHTIYRSTDTGRTWTLTGPSWGGWIAQPNSEGPILISSANGPNYFLSQDQAQTFEPIDTTGFEGDRIYNFVVAGNYLFATKAGVSVYRRPLQSNHVSESAQHSVHIYPNPVTNLLHVEADHAEIVIHDQLGNTVKHVTALSGDNTLDVSELPSGVYFVHMTNASGESVHRFIKL